MYQKVHQNGILPWNVTHFENVSFFKKKQQYLNFTYTTEMIINGHDPNIIKTCQNITVWPFIQSFIEYDSLRPVSKESTSDHYSQLKVQDPSLVFHYQ